MVDCSVSIFSSKKNQATRLQNLEEENMDRKLLKGYHQHYKVNSVLMLSMGIVDELLSNSKAEYRLELIIYYI